MTCTACSNHIVPDEDFFLDVEGNYWCYWCVEDLELNERLALDILDF